MIKHPSPIRRAGRGASHCSRRLFCLPPAGAGARLYYPWLDAVQANFDVCPVALPGREDRLAEALPASLNALADQMASELAPELDRPYALFGYSMGAMLGYELILRWQNAGLPTPEVFVTLAARAPCRPFDRPEPIHQLASAPFRQLLADVGGTPREILENDDAMAFFEPILRNDFRVSETYRCLQVKKLPCPILIFYGRRDTLLSEQDVAAWLDCTTVSSTFIELDEAHILSARTFAGLLDRVGQFWQALSRF